MNGSIGCRFDILLIKNIAAWLDKVYQGPSRNHPALLRTKRNKCHQPNAIVSIRETGVVLVSSII
jgi:hypothetical protein